jgi:hypothetical protein
LRPARLSAAIPTTPKSIADSKGETSAKYVCGRHFGAAQPWLAPYAASPALPAESNTRDIEWSRIGLSLKQAQTLLNTPDTSTLKGLRDRAIIAVEAAFFQRNAPRADDRLVKPPQRGRALRCIGFRRRIWNC